MSMVNVSLVGNLARAPEQICFASGKIKTILVIAVNSAAQKKQEKSNESAADFYRIETWGKLAELAQKYLNKGNQVGVSGRLIMEHWTDRNGQQRLTPVVSATQLSFPPRVSVAAINSSEKPVLRSVPDAMELEEAESEADSAEMTDDDLFAGAKAITVAEPPPHYYAGSSPYRTHRSMRRAVI